MTTLVDSNVLLDVFTADAAWPGWSRARLRESLLQGEVVVNPIAHAEVSLSFGRPEELDAELRRLGVVKAPLPYAAAFPAARAFLRYRRDGGERRSPLPDFYIGAHALTAGLRLLTRDASRFRAYFPELDLVAP